MSEERIFEVLDVEPSTVKAIVGRKGKESEYAKVLMDVARGRREKVIVAYHGKSTKLSGVVSTLRRTAKDKKINVDVAQGETEDGDRVLIVTKKVK